MAQGERAADGRPHDAGWYREIEQVNAIGVPKEFRTVDGVRAWLVPDETWTAVRRVAAVVRDPEGVLARREARRERIRRESEASMNDPVEQAALREEFEAWNGLGS